jgi:hypothetical protein
MVTIGGNFFLIPIAGYMGSSFAALLCYFLMTMICYWLGQNYFPIPYRLLKSFIYIAVTTGIVYAVNAVSIESQILATAFHGFIIILYIAVVFLIERKNLEARPA